jgi:hypothetical protein
MNVVKLRKVIVSGFALVSAFVPTPAQANLTYYTNPAEWRAAVGSYLTESFDTNGLQPFTVVDTVSGGIGPAGGMLTGSVWKDNVFENDFGYARTFFSSRAGSLFGAAAYFDPLGSAAGLRLKITLDGSLEEVAQVAPGLGGFIGWTSSRPFNNFLLWTDYRQFGGGVRFDMDNLEFAPVPEPGGSGLVVLGIFGGAILRRFRRA